MHVLVSHVCRNLAGLETPRIHQLSKPCKRLGVLVCATAATDPRKCMLSRWVPPVQNSCNSTFHSPNRSQEFWLHAELTAV